MKPKVYLVTWEIPEEKNVFCRKELIIGFGYDAKQCECLRGYHVTRSSSYKYFRKNGEEQYRKIYHPVKTGRILRKSCIVIASSKESAIRLCHAYGKVTVTASDGSIVRLNEFRLAVVFLNDAECFHGMVGKMSISI